MNFLRKHAIGIASRLSSVLSDKMQIKLLFYLIMGYRINLNNCKTFNEKLQWLKLYNHNPLLTSIVDKIEVKKIIADRIGEEYVVPLLDVWDKPFEITDYAISILPDKFVIKTNHSGGNLGVYICSDKQALNLDEVRKKMEKSLVTDLYTLFREWPYKNVKRRIFAEQYLGDNLIDYKFFCFDGDVDSVMVCLDRQKNGKPKYYFFDSEWNLKRYNIAGKEAPEDFTIPKPEGMEEMFRIASKLSKGFPFVRVDLYDIDDKIYFGEMTFFPASGFDPKILPEIDLYWGEKLNLNSIGKNK